MHTYDTVYIQSLSLHSIRICYVSADRLTASAAEHSPLFPLTPLSRSRSKINSGHKFKVSVSDPSLETANNVYQWPKHLKSLLHFLSSEYAEIFSSSALELGYAPPKDVLEINHSAHFYNVLFKRIFKHGDDCEDKVQRNKIKVLIKN